MNIFAKRLVLALDQAGMSAAELSRKTGIPQGMLSEYKSGKYKAKQENVYLISQALGVSPGWLMGMDEAPEQDLDSALTELIASLDDQQKAAALDYISFLKARHKE